MAKTYVFEFTEDQAIAIIGASLALCEGDSLSERKKPWKAILEDFSEAGIAVDEQMANQTREWEKCVCGGSGWLEEYGELYEKLKAAGFLA